MYIILNYFLLLFFGKYRAKLPVLFEHIEKLGVSYTIFSTKWFICLYIDVLPIEVIDKYSLDKIMIFEQ